MTNYDIFAKFYDAVMGNREKTAEKIRTFIKQSNPKAKNLLELASGTGAVLKYLSKDYKVSGLDLSKGMLAIAKKEVPQAKLYHQSMVSFKVPEKFDVILCVFDSINHIMKFSDWQKIFSSAYNHLNEGGVFIFDVNTQVKLVRHSKEPTWVRKFDGGIMLMKVQDVGRDIFNWNIKVFEHAKGNQYVLWEEDIKETNFSAKKITQSLNRFSSVKVIDTDRKRPSEKSDRLYFICKN